MIKIYLKKESDCHDLLIGKSLTPGKWYIGEPFPVMYDNFDKSYVVVCDDGKIRNVKSKLFITLGEWRENKLDHLGI